MCSDTTLIIRRKDREGKVRSEGEGEGEGKIEGRGTPLGQSPGLHVGWRGTRLLGRRAAKVRKGWDGNGLGRASSDRARWSFACAPV